MSIHRPVAHAVIPARYASTRFPGKPLVPIHGKPMFWHVWRRASQCPQLSSVTLATDDERILAAAVAIGVPALMTGKEHASGTDRVHEAARLLKLPGDAVIVNVQGDEPALDPLALSELLDAFADPAVCAATLAHPLDPRDLLRPDKVKVVTAHNGDALYFSRAPIPCARDAEERAGEGATVGACAPFAPLGHIGLYAFTMQTLERFCSLPPSPLERTEKLEQLRLLENSIPLRVVRTTRVSHGVDIEADLEKVIPLL